MLVETDTVTLADLCKTINSMERYIAELTKQKEEFIKELELSKEKVKELTKQLVKETEISNTALAEVQALQEVMEITNKIRGTKL